MFAVRRSDRRPDEVTPAETGCHRIPACIRRFTDALADAIFPARCMACDRLFLNAERTPDRAGGETEDFAVVMAPYFCSRCRNRWTRVTSPLCQRCGLVFKSRAGEDHLCGRCLDRPGHYTMARAAGIYDQSLRTAIHQLKFRGAAHLAEPLGRLLAGVFRKHWHPGEIDLIAPVPLHRRRFRHRGFNQAYLLVRRWRPAAGCTIDRELLIRARATASQRGLTRDQRRRNIKNAFAVRRPGRSAGLRILLVDDVFTTGATADACARALVRDGARRVDVLTLARAL